MRESSESLRAEIDRRRDELADAEWFLEILLDSNENTSWGTEEAAQAKLRADALADREIRDKLDAMEFSKRAHQRLDYLLSLSFSLIGIFNRRRVLALYEELQRSQDSGPVQ